MMSPVPASPFVRIIAACSAFVTSITTPPFCIFANPRFSNSVPNRSCFRSRSRGIVGLPLDLRAVGIYILLSGFHDARPGSDRVWSITLGYSGEGDGLQRFESAQETLK